MSNLFAADSGRFLRFSASIPGMLLDYSKNQITEQTMRLLFELAKNRNIEAKRDSMFAGDLINTTEMRAALHVALRGASDVDFFVDGTNVSEDVSAQLNRLQAFTEAIHSGVHLGATGKQFTDVVAIGIGFFRRVSRRTESMCTSFGVYLTENKIEYMQVPVNLILRLF